MEIKKIIENKIKKDREEFTPPKNDCEECARRPAGKYCSVGCYYQSRFDNKASYIKHALKTAPQYFDIDTNKEEEFVEFMRCLIDLFY